MKRFFVVFAVAGIGYFVAMEIQMRRAENPSRASVAKEIEYYTGYTMPNNVEIIEAYRSRPSLLLGDYHSCLTLKFTASEFQSFLADLSFTTEKRIEGSCRTGEGFIFEGQYFHDRQHEPDEFALIYSRTDDHHILLELITQ
ncbi:MAG: hypothetical protein AAFR20_06860 [Pseudomonadota bacterium]